MYKIVKNILITFLFITILTLTKVIAATPNTPINFDAEKDLQVELTWTLDGGDNGTGVWEIKYTTATDATSSTAEHEISSSGVSYVAGSTITYKVSNLIPHLTYYFWVRVRDDAEWSSYTSSMSAVAGLFSEVSGFTVSAVKWGSIDCGDYDNDGDLDIAIIGGIGFNSISKVYRNDSGVFTDLSLSLEDVRTGDIEWGDYDNDGDLDLVIIGLNSSSQRITKIYRNDTGNFTDINASLLGVVNSSVEWGDYDNDGDLDLLISGLDSSSDPKTKLYRNDGADTFTEIETDIVDTSQSVLALGDYDNDGDLDLFISGFITLDNMPTKIYNNNNGVFNDSGISITNIGGGSAAWGDYDNDGDLDLAVSGYDASVNFITRIYNNNNLSFNSYISLENFIADKLLWTDYDNDGDLDLTASGINSSNQKKIMMYRNNGDNTFTNIDPNLLGTYYKTITWCDFDNDLDLDFIAVSTATAKLYKSYESEIGNSNTAPNAPSNLSSTTNAGKLEFRWDKATDAQTASNGLYYEIQVATESITDNLTNFIVSVTTGAGVQKFGNYTHGFVSALQPGLNLDPIVSNSTYYFRVRTIDTSFGRSSWLSGPSVYVEEIIPTVPILVNPSDNYATNYDTIEFTWNKSVPTSNVSFYELQISTDINFGIINHSSITTSTTAIITGITDNEYFWRVRAKNTQTSYTTWTSTRSFAVSVNTPLAPYNFTAEKALQISLDFQAQGGTNGPNGIWDIRYSTNSNATALTAEHTTSYININYVSGQNYSLSLGGFVPNTTYYFFMRARDNDSVWSEFTNQISAVAGIFEEILNVGLPLADYPDVSWGDYDNDGDLDLAICGGSDPSDYVIEIYRNDNGVLTDINAGLPDVYRGALSWGDYDNDGDLDLVFLGSRVADHAAITKIYRNDNGTFTDSGISLFGVSHGALAWGDYDNDGDLDFAYSGSNSGYHTRIYRNDNGSFVYISAGLTGVYESSISWGDYDNDSDLDLVVIGRNASSRISTIYRNDSGTFTNINAGLEGCEEGAVSWCDYDSDGDLDLALIGRISDGYSKIYRNDNGIFTEVGNNFFLGGSFQSSLSWGDYNNDGDADLAVCNKTDFKIFDNNAGSFTDSGINLGEGDNQQPDISFGDYDADGDLDIIKIGNTSSKLYRSYTSLIKTNDPPSVPSSNLNTNYNTEQGVVEITWDKPSDAETPSNGLYYDIRVATNSINDQLDKWLVSPSTGAGTGSADKQTFGNYPHGFVSSDTLQAGLNLKVTVEDTTYYWQTRSIDPALRKSAWSVMTSTFIPNIKPTVPVVVSPENNFTTAYNSLTFDWNGSTDIITGIKDYELQVSTDINFSFIDYSSITTLTLATIEDITGATYYFRVRARDNLDLYGDFSSIQGIIIDIIPPSVVSIERPVDKYKTEFGSVTFSWIASTDILGIAGYELQLSSAVNFATIDYSSNTVLTTATVSNLGIDLLYVKVRAKNNAGKYSSWSSTISINRVGALPPVNFKGVALSTHTIAWSWENVSTKATGYGVGGVTTTLANNATYYEETELSANKDYTRYAESYYNTDGSTETSNNATVFTLANAPSGLSPSEIKKHSVTLSWSGNGGKNYMIEQKEATESWEVVVGTVTEVTKKITHLKPSTTYYFSVKARNGNDILTESSSTYKVVTLNVPGSRLDPTKENKEERDVTLKGKNLKVKITIPAGTVGEVVYVTIDDPLTNPVEVDSSVIVEADVTIEEGKKSLGLFLELNMYTLIGDKVGSFAKKVTIEFPYSDVNQDGIIDGTKIPEESVEIYVLNETSSEWELVGGVVDTLANVVIAELSHFSVYTLISKKLASDNLDNVKVYPNPYKVGTGGRFDRPGGIMFKNLTAKANIRVYNIVGKLVYEYAEDNGDGEYEWDGTNTYGKNLASGIYIYIIKNPEASEDKAKGKLGIIR